jgi:hypothetical protein
MRTIVAAAIALLVLQSAILCCAAEPPVTETSTQKSDYIFKAGQIAFGASVAADLWSTKVRLFDNPGNGFREANPMLPGTLPGFASVMIGSAALTEWGSLRLHRGGHKWMARGILWGGFALHSWAAAHNWRLTPAGVPVR